MSNNSLSVMTSRTDSPDKEEWATPKRLFDAMNQVNHYQVDLAASAHNAKCAQYLTREDDSLSTPWTPARFGGATRYWLNPPYGRELPLWLLKARQAAEEAEEHAVLVSCLVPARVETRYWFELVWRPGGVTTEHDLGMEIIREESDFRTSVLLLQGRVSFVLPSGKSAPAPFPSAVITYSSWRPQ